MDEIAYYPAALDDLEVDATATASADPAFFILREWVKMKVSERMTTVLNKQDLTGVVYMNTNNELQAVSIISSPNNRLQRDKWLVGQLGNRLSSGPEGI
mmetsp:Transcript_52778/g.57264  ORF Transcript_52778/g.57264 Transcript_52778/m.57264 type:complete len:99 (-) Transcript_52778:177-473(-)